MLELRAAIEPGASGGPLVLPNGTVGGVVFAESRTDETVGYALDPAAVALAIDARHRARPIPADTRALHPVAQPYTSPRRPVAPPDPRTPRCPTAPSPTTSRATRPSATRRA